ncbi:unnamed protein product, partial [Brenthis ino]
MFKFLSKLEDPEHPLLGPTLWGLQTWGMWQPIRGKIKIIYNTIHLLAIIFVITQYVELWYIRSNLELALRNLSVTMLSTVCVVKATTFILWQKSWANIFEYVSTVEKQQLIRQNAKTKNIIKQYTKYSRKVTYSYWCLVTATVFTVILAPLASYISSEQRREQIANGTAAYPEIMSSWTPFDKTRGVGYWALVIIQCLICFYGGGIVATYDSNAVVLMSFFAGQFEFLREKCADLFGNGNEFEGTTTMQQVWIAEYLVALVAQLFLYCWHSNEVLYMSSKVDEGVYASAWWSQGVRIRRIILLLGGQLDRSVIFTAGPFTNLTVATFIAVSIHLDDVVVMM